MGTVDKSIADRVIAGEFEDDRPVKIIKYTNALGDEAYSLVCAHENQDRYAASEFVINPTLYWTHQ